MFLSVCTYALEKEMRKAVSKGCDYEIRFFPLFNTVSRQRRCLFKLGVTREPRGQKERRWTSDNEEIRVKEIYIYMSLEKNNYKLSPFLSLFDLFRFPT